MYIYVHLRVVKLFHTPLPKLSQFLQLRAASTNLFGFNFCR